MLLIMSSFCSIGFDPIEKSKNFFTMCTELSKASQGSDMPCWQTLHNKVVGVDLGFCVSSLVTVVLRCGCKKKMFMGFWQYTRTLHCSYLNIYISWKIRLCVVDLENQFQTTLLAKDINFWSENSGLLFSFSFYCYSQKIESFETHFCVKLQFKHLNGSKILI